MKQPRRSLLLTAAALLGAAVVFAVAGLGSRRLFERSNGPSGGTRRDLPLHGVTRGGGVLFHVAGLQGPVQALHGGHWYVVQAGDTLSTQDVVRTPPGSRALLRRGGSELELRGGMDIRLDELAERTARFHVMRGGRVTTTVSGDDEAVTIGAEGTDTINRGVARWVVSVDPRGRVSVVAAKGTVRFAAQGREVMVTEGTESAALLGKPPTPPETIPAELLLRVIWPEADQIGSRAHLRGQASPSSLVRINGVETAVAADGQFSALLPVASGGTPVEVQEEDLQGRKKTLRGEIKRPPRAPRLESGSEDIWKP